MDLGHIDETQYKRAVSFLSSLRSKALIKTQYSINPPDRSLYPINESLTSSGDETDNYDIHESSSDFNRMIISASPKINDSLSAEKVCFIPKTVAYSCLQELVRKEEGDPCTSRKCSGDGDIEIRLLTNNMRVLGCRGSWANKTEQQYHDRFQHHHEGRTSSDWGQFCT